MQVKVKFAGQSYTVEKQVAGKLKMDKLKVGGKNSELDSLVNMIDNKDKNINVVQKTKLDWESYTKE